MIEDVANNLLAALQAGLQAQLTAVQNAREPSFVLTAPLTRSWFTSDVLPSLVQDYPAGFVRSKRTTMADWVGRNRKLIHELDVVYLFVHSDPNSLAKLALRFVEATENVLNTGTNRTLSNTVIEMHSTTHDYSPAWPMPEAQMMAGGLVAIEVQERIQAP